MACCFAQQTQGRLGRDSKSSRGNWSAIKDEEEAVNRNGFKCRFMERSDSAEREEGNHPLGAQEYRFPIFDRDEQADCPATRRSQIAKVHKNASDADTLVSITHTCP